MLFELSRHSYHHFFASRKYRMLQHHVNATTYRLFKVYDTCTTAATLINVMNKKIKLFSRGVTLISLLWH
ncbi:MAG: hypothetical protein ABIT07_02860 [Ferruginibacter sp.]